MILLMSLFFFQAEDGIRDWSVTGVQTCALPISSRRRHTRLGSEEHTSELPSTTNLVRLPPAPAPPPPCPARARCFFVSTHAVPCRTGPGLLRDVLPLSSRIRLTRV